MSRMIIAIGLSATTILLAIGATQGLVPAAMAETAVITLPALAVVTMRPAKACNPLKAFRA